MTAVTSVPLHDRARPVESMRILLAVHGSEPEGWGDQTRRILAMWTNPSVRILAVIAVPCPPFTALIPPAARLYRGAREAWRAAEEKRVRRVIDTLTPGLPREPEVVWATVSYREPGRTIAEHARAWAADVLLMAVTPATGLWLDRVVHHAGCPVLLSPAPDARREA